MKQISLFAEENRFEKLSELGDCLERLKIIDWESFRPTIALALIRERKSNAGRPPYDCILLFKTIVLQRARRSRVRRQCLRWQEIAQARPQRGL